MNIKGRLMEAEDSNKLCKESNILISRMSIECRRMFTDFRRIAQVGIVRQVQKDQKERDDVNDEAQNDDWIATDFVRRSSAQQSKGDATAHLSNSNENTRQSHQLFRRLANRLCKSNTRRINTAEKRKLKT